MKTSWTLLSIFPVLFSILCTIAVKAFGFVLVSIPVDSAFHFSLMTVNALIGGFLYSNYGMLVGLLDNDTIQKVKGTAIMTKRNSQVLRGIVYATLSVACGLYITLIGIQTSPIWEWIFCWMINGEIVFMIAAMAFYLLSLKEMNQLVKALYKTGKHLSRSEVTEIKKKVVEECEAQPDD